MLGEWILYGAEIIVANNGLNAATLFGNKVLEEHACIVAVRPTYHFYGDVEQDIEQIEIRIGADKMLCES